MILVDTSVWIDHFRSANPELSSLLEAGQVLCHPFVVGELACGNLKNRGEILSLLEKLPSTSEASHAEVMSMVNERALFGSGIGWVDAHLLSGALLSRASIWTKDKSLAAAADSLGISH